MHLQIKNPMRNLNLADMNCVIEYYVIRQMQK